MSSCGVLAMQSLLARHGKSVVRAGPLQGTTFEEVPRERILKAAKRYTGDPDFSRFARSFALLSELQGEDIPEPCMPLVPVGESKDAKGTAGVAGCLQRLLHAWRRVLSWSRYGKIFLLLIFLALIFRPMFARMVSKLVVTTVRVSLRRVLTFCISILEGLLDELIYQVDHMMRDALPIGVNVQESVGATFTLISHLISSSVGAALTLLVQMRRAQVQQ